MEDLNINKVGLIGLGNMGSGIAETLLRQGIDVDGFDLNTTACNHMAQLGVNIISIDKLLENNELVILSLPKAEHVGGVAKEILRFGKHGQIVIDTSTSTPEVSRKIYTELQTKGITFIDAPVSGGPKGAKNGTMTMVVGAKEEVFGNIKPFLTKISSVQVNVGNCGSGNIVKICNNLLAAAHLITTAEAISLANKAGVTPENLLAGLNKGSGRSAVSEINFPHWILNDGYDSGFTMGLMRKDVALAKDLACEEGVFLPLSEMVMRLWEESADSLTDTQDFNEIVKISDKSLF